MGERELVDIILKMVKTIKEQRGELNLFMILVDEDIPDNFTYSLLISAKWLDTISPYEGIKIVTNYLINALDDSFIYIISRIIPINSEDPSVKKISKGLRMSGYSHIINSYFFNVLIKDAILFESN